MAGITVQEVDLVPSLTGITKLQFDQADGFTLTQPVAGTVRVDYVPAAAPDHSARLLALWTEFGGETSGSGPSGGFMLEDGSGHILLEDGSGRIT